MHCAEMLFADMFEIEVGDRAGTIDDIFPEWHEYDRFGILIDSILGGLGATHLIQVATTSFYDVKPSRRSEKKVYPEIYAFHIGQDFGAHAAFDFWPARREVITSTDHREILDAINDRAITRLAIPGRPRRDLHHRPKEVDAALGLIKTAVAYSNDGIVMNPDFSIRGKGRQSEHNPRQVLRPPFISTETVELLQDAQSRSKEVDYEYRQMVARRHSIVSAAERDAIARRRSKIAMGDGVRETYRFISVEDALHSL